MTRSQSARYCPDCPTEKRTILTGTQKRCRMCAHAKILADADARYHGVYVPVIGTPLICDYKPCSKTVPRTNANQKYCCPECAELAHKETDQRHVVGAGLLNASKASDAQIQANIDRIVAEAKEREGHDWGGREYPTGILRRRLL